MRSNVCMATRQIEPVISMIADLEEFNGLSIERKRNVLLLLLFDLAMLDKLIAPCLIQARLEMQDARFCHGNHMVVAGESMRAMPICICTSARRLAIAVREHLVLRKYLDILRRGRRQRRPYILSHRKTCDRLHQECGCGGARQQRVAQQSMRTSKIHSEVSVSGTASMLTKTTQVTSRGRLSTILENGVSK